MPEYSEVEQPFLQQLSVQGWTVVDQGCAKVLPNYRERKEWLRQRGAYLGL